MVGPVPGSAPNSVPMPVPRSIGQNDCLISARLGRMSRMRTRACDGFVVVRLTLTRKSAMPNSPIVRPPSSMPSRSSVTPSV